MELLWEQLFPQPDSIPLELHKQSCIVIYTDRYECENEKAVKDCQPGSYCVDNEKAIEDLVAAFKLEAFGGEFGQCDAGFTNGEFNCAQAKEREYCTNGVYGDGVYGPGWNQTMGFFEDPKYLDRTYLDSGRSAWSCPEQSSENP